MHSAETMYGQALGFKKSDGESHSILPGRYTSVHGYCDALLPVVHSKEIQTHTVLCILYIIPEPDEMTTILPWLALR